MTRPFGPFGEIRATRILARIMTLSDIQVASEIVMILAEFQERHYLLDRTFLKLTLCFPGVEPSPPINGRLILGRGHG
jgi:hypothetical protein